MLWSVLRIHSPCVERECNWAEVNRGRGRWWGCFASWLYPCPYLAVGEGQSGCFCIFSYNCMWIHSYLKVSLILKDRTRSSRAYVDLKVSLFQSWSDQRVLKENRSFQSSIKSPPLSLPTQEREEGRRRGREEGREGENGAERTG